MKSCYDCSWHLDHQCHRPLTNNVGAILDLRIEEDHRERKRTFLDRLLKVDRCGPEGQYWQEKEEEEAGYDPRRSLSDPPLKPKANDPRKKHL